MMSLPEDLEFEILQCLPVKSLIRFRCVCKQWRTRFRSPNFINAHHLKQVALDGDNLSNSNFMIKSFQSNGFGDHGRDMCFSSFNTSSNAIGSIKENIYIPVFAFPRLNSITLKVLGPVRGIFCLVDANLVALWNPATREFNILPDSTLNRPTTEFPPLYNYGFGFDSKSNDYKVVAFLSFPLFESSTEVYTQREVYTHQIEVYSLSTDSWKLIPSDVYPVNYISTCTTSINGVIHCLAFPITQQFNSIEFIVSFDMADEVFFKTPLPELGYSCNMNRWWLDTIDDCPAFIVSRPYENMMGAPQYYDVWLLKEAGVKESWIKKRITPISSMSSYFVKGFRKNGVVFEGMEGLQLMMYDSSTEELKNLHVSLPFPTPKMILLIYVESLVSINGRKKSINSKSLQSLFRSFTIEHNG